MARLREASSTWREYPGRLHQGAGAIGSGQEHLEHQGLVVPPDVGEVYVADHVRAVLDLVYRSLTRWGRVRNLVGATTDWFETYEDGVTVLEYAARPR